MFFMEKRVVQYQIQKSNKIKMEINAQREN